MCFQHGRADAVHVQAGLGVRGGKIFQVVVAGLRLMPALHEQVACPLEIPEQPGACLLPCLGWITAAGYRNGDGA